MKTQLVEVDNGIYETIRLLLVAGGYLPNVLDYPGDPGGYEAAKQSIRDLQKPIIELENSSAYDSRNTIKDSVIVINRMLVDPASVGVGQDWEYQYNADDDDYDKSLSPTSKYDITYQISYVTGLEEVASIIEGLLFQAFSNRKFINALKSSDNSVVSGFMFHRLQSFDTSADDFIERGARYIAKYIDLEGNTALGKIAKFKFSEFILDVDPLKRDVLLKQIIEVFAVDGITVTSYDDLYKLGLTVEVNFEGDTVVVGPHSELYKVNADGTITYLNPDL